MKKHLVSLIFIAATLSTQAQNVASSANITSGGFQAGNSGTSSSFYGYRAGNNNTGTQNTFIGLSAGEENATGNNNTYIGHQTGGNNGGESNNTYIGSNAGYENWGSNNTYIGANAGYDSPGGSGNILIGYNAGNGFQTALNNKLFIENSSSEIPLIWGDFANDKLKFNGKVGIGYNFGTFPTTAGGVNVSGYNLFVNGGILTEEVRVMLKTQWADYVFADNYNLKPLKEVEQFIKQNGHLPNVPSAAQVKENGIEVGEIITIQQEKIEELTLHLINQEKQLEELKAQVKQLLQAQN